MAKRMIIMLICLGILFGLVFGIYMIRKHKIAEAVAKFHPPATTVSSSKAKEETWESYLSAVGSITAISGVDVTTQTNGMVDKIYFTSGSIVKKGAPLVDLDDRLEVASLKNNNAQLALAKITYTRSLDLFKKGAQSKSTLDTDKANLEEAQANVESTQTQLSYFHIKAPFSGDIGIRQVDLGEYIQPGTSIASLQSLDPLYVQFYINEQDIKKISVGQSITLTTDAYPDKEYKGTVTALDSELNSSSRSISVIATVANKDMKLLPNMFAHVHIMLPEKRQIVVLPQTAISYNLYGDAVYIIKGKTDKDGKSIQVADLVYIKVGERRGDTAEIISGVKVGDSVVSSGQVKLNSGAEVSINNTVEP
jgi:membrane fusion protein (multidrug efflux system)